MFAISHSYIATKVLGRKSDLLIFGGVLPDIRMVVDDDSPLGEFHGMAREFYDFVIVKYPNLADLAMGVRLHCGEDRGADYYSDDWDEGYAVVNGREIQHEVGNLIEDWDTDSLVLAHNLVEAALEIKIQQYDPEIGKIYAKALENCDMEMIAKCLADFLKMEPSEVSKNLEDLKNYFGLEHLSNVEHFAKDIFVPGINKRYKKEIKEPEKIVELITKSEKLIKDSYVEYFEDAIIQVRNNFKDLK